VLPVKATPTPAVPTTTTKNSRSVDELKTIRETIRSRNEEVANGIYSKIQNKNFDHIYVIQVHSRHEFLAYLLETMSKIIGLNDGTHLLGTFCNFNDNGFIRTVIIRTRPKNNIYKDIVKFENTHFRL